MPSPATTPQYSTDYRYLTQVQASGDEPERKIIAGVIAQAVTDIQSAAKAIRQAERKHTDEAGRIDPVLIRSARRILRERQVATAFALIDALELGPAIRRRLADDIDTLERWIEGAT